MTSRSGSPYALDQLGWLGFERLAELVLEAETGLSELAWRGSADTRRVADVGVDVALVGCGRRLVGPVTVAVVWVRDDFDATVRLFEFAACLTEILLERDGRLLVLTNLDETQARRALPSAIRTDPNQALILGAECIGASLDRHPSIRAAMPSVLGLRELSGLIDDEVASRSSLDVLAAQELARVFWSTRAHGRALQVLGAHRFVVLTGPPEMGKTAVAQMLALALMTDGWEAHECTDPEQVWRHFDPQRRQVFVADDAFGSTEYRPDAAERWAAGLGRLLTMLDAEHWLIWTSRPAPLKAGLRRIQRERGTERFPAPGEVLVDAGELDLAEKTLILFRHAKAQGLSDQPRELVRSMGVKIVEHPHFTPERIRRFVTGRLGGLGGSASHDPGELLRAIRRELASPTEAMRASFHALELEHRDLLIALLDAPAGLIDERELAGTVRRHRVGGLSRPPAELIDRLTDHFLRVSGLGIGWVHPSWRDLVIEELRQDASARRRFLAASGIDGVTLALSHAGGPVGERSLPLLIDDRDWDTLGDRVHQLLREFDDRDIARLLQALGGAVDAAGDAGAKREAITLAGDCLGTLKRAWERQPGAIPGFLLEAWFSLSAMTGDLLDPLALDPPELGLTWIELHPGAMLGGRLGREELMRIDDWLALAELLDRHAPSALVTFDFFGADRQLIAHAIPALAAAATHAELRDLAESVLTRISGLLPLLGSETSGAIETGREVQDDEAGRWWVPDDLPTPPSLEFIATDAFTARDVGRVLGDL
jgi:hypothetical protein